MSEITPSCIDNYYRIYYRHADQSNFVLSEESIALKYKKVLMNTHNKDNLAYSHTFLHFRTALLELFNSSKESIIIKNDTCALLAFPVKEDKEYYSKIFFKELAAHNHEAVAKNFHKYLNRKLLFTYVYPNGEFKTRLVKIVKFEKDYFTGVVGREDSLVYRNYSYAQMREMKLLAHQEVFDDVSFIDLKTSVILKQTEEERDDYSVLLSVE